MKTTLKQESKRFGHLNSQLALTRHQLASYSEEAALLQSKLRSCLFSFTKDQCADLRKTKTPISSLVDLTDKLLLLLDIKDRSWKGFRSVSKNFTALKSLMSSIQTEQQPDNVINEILPLWKNQGTIRTKLSKFNPGACVLLDWVTFVVEFNVKAEMAASSKKRIPELEKMVKYQSKTLNDLTTESISIEEVMNKTKADLDEQVLDCEELSLTSKPFFINSQQDERHIFHFTVHRGTASGGIMHSGKAKTLEETFPNFNSEHLYGEIPVDKHADEPIVFEGKTEAVGCCRMKFFCF